MDHYQTLGISKAASPEEIKKAYKAKIFENPPNEGGEASVRTREIIEAYAALKEVKAKADDEAQTDFDEAAAGAARTDAPWAGAILSKDLSKLDGEDIYGLIYALHVLSKGPKPPLLENAAPASTGQPAIMDDARASFGFKQKTDVIRDVLTAWTRKYPEKSEKLAGATIKTMMHAWNEYNYFLRSRPALGQYAQCKSAQDFIDHCVYFKTWLDLVPESFNAKKGHISNLCQMAGVVWTSRKPEETLVAGIALDGMNVLLKKDESLARMLVTPAMIGLTSGAGEDLFWTLVERTPATLAEHAKKRFAWGDFAPFELLAGVAPEVFAAEDVADMRKTLPGILQDQMKDPDRRDWVQQRLNAGLDRCQGRPVPRQDPSRFSSLIFR